MWLLVVLRCVRGDVPLVAERVFNCSRSLSVVLFFHGMEAFAPRLYGAVVDSVRVGDEEVNCAGEPAPFCMSEAYLDDATLNSKCQVLSPPIMDPTLVFHFFRSKRCFGKSEHAVRVLNVKERGHGIESGWNVGRSWHDAA